MSLTSSLLKATALPGRLTSTNNRPRKCGLVHRRPNRHLVMAVHQATGVQTIMVDQTMNPLVASLKVSKTMALTDMARSMRESGVDVSHHMLPSACV